MCRKDAPRLSDYTFGGNIPMVLGYVSCRVGKRSLFLCSASKRAQELTQPDTAFPFILKSQLVLSGVYATLSLLANAMEILSSNYMAISKLNALLWS